MNTTAVLTDDPSVLDPSVTSLMLQFRFIDRSLVSSFLWTGEREKLRKEDDQRLGPGTKVILPTLRVGLKAFLLELDDSEFGLIDATGEEVTNSAGKPEKVVRFIFRRRPLPPINVHFAAFLAGHARVSLERLCSEAMWQLCMFRNPRKDGVGISINCNARFPYIDGDNKRTADRYLRIDEGRVYIEEA